MVPLPTAQYRATGFYDLQRLLRAISTTSAQDRFGRLLLPRSKFTTSHLQWISNVLLHLSWAQITPDDSWIRRHSRLIDKLSMPLDALLNRLLMFCNLLGWKGY